MYRAINQNEFYRICDIARIVKDYMREKGHLPNADSWCDELSREHQNGELFQIGQFPDIQCVFAFNKNLSNTNADIITKSAVMIFEADGQINQAD
jgi:hypothetical protein